MSVAPAQSAPGFRRFESWLPETPARAVLLCAAITLGLVLLRLVAELAFGDLRGGVSEALLGDLRNYRISFVVSLLTGFAAAASAYGLGAEKRDHEAFRREVGLDPAELERLIAALRPRSLPALLVALATAPIGLLLVTGRGTSTPVLFTNEPLDFGLIWALGANLLLFAVMGCTAYLTFTARRIDRVLDALPLPLDLLDSAGERRIVAGGSRLAFFWLVGSSLASLIFVDLSFAWTTGAVVAVTLSVGTWLFVAPLVQMARRIRAQKARELARVRERIRRARDALLEGDGNTEHGRELPALLAYEQRIERVPEWAVDLPQIVRFVALALLALGSWLGGAIVERLLDFSLR